MGLFCRGDDERGCDSGHGIDWKELNDVPELDCVARNHAVSAEHRIDCLSGDELRLALSLVSKLFVLILIKVCSHTKVP